MPDRPPGAATRTRARQLATPVWVLLIVLAGLAQWALTAAAQEPRRFVYRVVVDGTIDLGLAPFVARVLEQADREGARAVVLDINTFGGRVDAAVLIRDALLKARVPTIAFVNPRAISAGALITLAAEKVAMADGGTIGAATPVSAGAPGAAAQPVAEKTVSYLRKEFRATAEARKRPPMVAEAMVDADVQIDGLIDKGKLLTLTTAEAIERGIADVRADTLGAALKAFGHEGVEVREAAPTWAESLVRFLTNPIVSSLLMTVGIIGLITEIRTPGLGAPGAIGVASLALFFWGHWLVQLAGFEELLLVATGLTLVLVEVFLTPGFGVAGILGLAALVTGLGASLVGSGATWDHALGAVWQAVISLIAALIGTLLLLRWLPRLPWGRRLVLASDLAAGQGWASAPEADRARIGLRGTTVTPLHPSGLAHLGDERVDVVSEGEFIDSGKSIEVVRVDGNRVVVREVDAAARQE